MNPEERIRLLLLLEKLEASPKTAEKLTAKAAK